MDRRRGRGRVDGGGGGGGPRAARGARRGREDDEDDDFDEEDDKTKKKKGEAGGDGDDAWTADQDVKAWLEGESQGVATDFEPSLTRESLVGYGSALATAPSAAMAGQVEGVVRSLRVLGGGVPSAAR